jgi:hypothetical protein
MECGVSTEIRKLFLFNCICRFFIHAVGLFFRDSVTLGLWTVQVVESKTQLFRWWSILLLRQHVSALALGHHEVSNYVLKETIQCTIYIAHNIQ